jgi:hypothetical protein
MCLDGWIVPPFICINIKIAELYLERPLRSEVNKMSRRNGDKTRFLREPLYAALPAISQPIHCFAVSRQATLSAQICLPISPAEHPTCIDIYQGRKRGRRSTPLDVKISQLDVNWIPELDARRLRQSSPIAFESV